VLLVRGLHCLLEFGAGRQRLAVCASRRQHTSAYISIRQHCLLEFGAERQRLALCLDHLLPFLGLLSLLCDERVCFLQRLQQQQYVSIRTFCTSKARKLSTCVISSSRCWFSMSTASAFASCFGATLTPPVFSAWPFKASSNSEKETVPVGVSIRQHSSAYVSILSPPPGSSKP
jgi:hypothetical protein